MRQILNVNKSVNETTMLEYLGYMNAKQLILYRTVLFLYKIINGQAPTYLTDRIKYRHEIHNRNLRNANDIDVSDAIKTCSQNSLFYKGIRLFNSIPLEIREADTFNKFKKLLEQYIRNNL